MTPRETLAAMEAAAWRLEQAQRGRAWLAWHVAALSRARQMPSLGRLLQAPEAQSLEGEELDKRRAEFAELKERIAGDTAGLGERILASKKKGLRRGG